MEIAHLEDIHRSLCEQQRRAANLEERPRRHHHFWSGDRIEKYKRQQERTEITGPHDLQWIHITEQIFPGGVEAGKSSHRSTHQSDAGEALAALVRQVAQ